MPRRTFQDARTALIIILLLTLSVCWPHSKAQAGAPFADAISVEKRTDLVPHTEYLSDPSGGLRLENIFSSKVHENFLPLSSGIPLQASGVTWLRFTLAPGSAPTAGGPILLDLGDRTPDGALVYTPKDSIPSSSGPSIWILRRPADNGMFKIPAPEKDMPISIYVRIPATPDLWFAPSLLRENYTGKTADRLGYYLGFCVLGFLTALCLLRAFRDGGEWRLWTAVVAALILAQSMLKTPALPVGISYYIPALLYLLVPSLGLIMLPHTGRHLWNTAETCKKLDKLLAGLSVAGGILPLSMLVPGLAWTEKLLPLWPVLAVFCAFAAIFAMKAGLPAARRYFLCMLLLSISSLLTLLAQTVNNPNGFLLHAPIWGGSITALLLGVMPIRSRKLQEPAQENSEKEPDDSIILLNDMLDAGSIPDRQPGSSQEEEAEALLLKTLGGEQPAKTTEANAQIKETGASEPAGKQSPSSGQSVYVSPLPTYFFGEEGSSKVGEPRPISTPKSAEAPAESPEAGGEASGPEQTEQKTELATPAASEPEKNAEDAAGGDTSKQTDNLDAAATATEEPTAADEGEIAITLPAEATLASQEAVVQTTAAPEDGSESRQSLSVHSAAKLTPAEPEMAVEDATAAPLAVQEAGALQASTAGSEVEAEKADPDETRQPPEAEKITPEEIAAQKPESADILLLEMAPDAPGSLTEEATLPNAAERLILSEAAAPVLKIAIPHTAESSAESTASEISEKPVPKATAASSPEASDTELHFPMAAQEDLMPESAQSGLKGVQSDAQKTPDEASCRNLPSEQATGQTETDAQAGRASPLPPAAPALSLTISEQPEAASQAAPTGDKVGQRPANVELPWEKPEQQPAKTGLFSRFISSARKKQDLPSNLPPAASGQPMTGGQSSAKLLPNTRMAQGSGRSPLDPVALSKIEQTLKMPLEPLLQAVKELGNCSLPPLAKVQAEIIENKGNELARLIGNLGREQEELSPGSDHHDSADTVFDLQVVLSEAHDAVVAKAERRGLALSWFMPPHLPLLYKGNPGQLQDVLSLLLDSAIESTDKGSIQLAVRRLPDSIDPGRLVFSVSDAGQTSPSLRRSTTALLKAWELTAAQGGSLSLDSTPNGTVVAFTLHLSVPGKSVSHLLPLFPAQSDENTESDNGKGQMRPLTILAVAEQTTNRQMISFFLNDLPYLVQEARSVEEALASYIENPAGMVIFDESLSEPDLQEGINRLHEIDASQNIPPVPVVILTQDKKDDEKPVPTGSQAIIRKPMSRSQVRETVETLLPIPEEVLKANARIPSPEQGTTEAAAQQDATPAATKEPELPAVSVQDIPEPHLPETDTPGQAPAAESAAHIPVIPAETPGSPAMKDKSQDELSVPKSLVNMARRFIKIRRKPYSPEQDAPETAAMQIETLPAPEAATQDNQNSGQDIIQEKGQDYAVSASEGRNMEITAPEPLEAGQAVSIPDSPEGKTAPESPMATENNSDPVPLTEKENDRERQAEGSAAQDTEAETSAQAVVSAISVPAAPMPEAEAAPEQEEQAESENGASGPLSEGGAIPVQAEPAQEPDAPATREANLELQDTELAMPEPGLPQTAKTPAQDDTAPHADSMGTEPEPGATQAEQAPGQPETAQAASITASAAQKEMTRPDQGVTIEGEEIDPEVIHLIPGLLDSLEHALHDAYTGLENKSSLGISEACVRMAGTADAHGLRGIKGIANCVERAANANDLEAVTDLLAELDNAIKSGRANLEAMYREYIKQSL